MARRDLCNPETFAIAPLRSRAVQLCLDASAEDYRRLFGILADPRLAPFVFGDVNLRTSDNFADTFKQWEEREFGHRFLVRHDRRGIVGFVFEYSRRLADGHSKFSIIMEHGSVNSGYGATAAALFVNWLFAALKIDGIFFEVFAYNRSVVRALRSLRRYLNHDLEETVVPNFKFWDGMWAKHMFRIYRDDWLRIRSVLLRNVLC